MKILLPEVTHEEAVADLSLDFDVHYEPALIEDRAALCAAVKDADGLIVRNRTQVNEELLQIAPKLKVVGRLGVGLDNIDVKGCEARGTKVLIASGANNVSVAEYVIASTFALLRHSFFDQDRMIDGSWPREMLMNGHEISGKTMGIVGYGSIGQEVSSRARALGMKVAATDPAIAADDPVWENITRCPSLHELLSVADVLTLHVPLLDATRNLIDGAAIERMKEGAIIINAARGGIVDEDALVDGMRSGRVGGAALDVFTTEPLDAEAGKKFAGLRNIILTPHIAGVTQESFLHVCKIIAKDVRAVLQVGEKVQ